ncbi:EnvZ/OmpR regulon moderator MzrA [Prodigiosinella confusarubida]
MLEKEIEMIAHYLKHKHVWRILLVVLPAIILTPSSRHPQDDAMLHITPQYQGATLPDGFYIYQRLNERGIGIKSITPSNDSIIVRLSSPEQSSAAREILSMSLPQVNVVTQAPDPTPFWRHKLIQQQSKLG